MYIKRSVCCLLSFLSSLTSSSSAFDPMVHYWVVSQLEFSIVRELFLVPDGS